jgi:hypothetical protein
LEGHKHSGCSNGLGSHKLGKGMLIQIMSVSEAGSLKFYSVGNKEWLKVWEKIVNLNKGFRVY